MDGYRENSDGECEECEVSGCKDCSTSIDTCDECKEFMIYDDGECKCYPGYTESHGKCVPYAKQEPCGFGMYEDNDECHECYATCLQCSDGDHDSCTSCVFEKHYKLVDGVCELEDGYYIDYNKGKKYIEDCPDTCKTCAHGSE